MAETLTSMRAKLADVLQDPAGLVFDSAAIDGAIRTALAEYSLAKGTPQTLDGLEGAAATTFPDVEAVVITIGAAGYAVEGRVFKRSESFNFKQYSSPEIRLWADSQLKLFRAYLKQIRAGSFRGAGAAAWPDRGWAMDAWDPNTV